MVKSAGGKVAGVVTDPVVAVVTGVAGIATGTLMVIVVQAFITVTASLVNTAAEVKFMVIVVVKAVMVAIVVVERAVAFMLVMVYLTIESTHVNSSLSVFGLISERVEVTVTSCAQWYSTGAEMIQLVSKKLVALSSTLARFLTQVLVCENIYKFNVSNIAIA